MGSTWQKALSQAWTHSSTERAYAFNGTYNKYGSGWVGSGMVSLYTDEHVVENLYTRMKREGLTEEQVDSTLQELAIDNSNWVHYR